MKSISYCAVLALVVSFGGVSASADNGAAPAFEPAVTVSTSATVAGDLQRNLAFDPQAEFAAHPGRPDKCSFKPSKNPLRQRKNECRLA